MARAGRRGRKPLPESERKDRLVQARVGEDLDDALREAAKKQRVSVSQLVRNILEDTFHLVDDLVVGAANLTETVVRDVRRVGASAKRVGESARELGATAKRFTASAGKRPAVSQAKAAMADVLSGIDDVSAWQQAVVAKATPCARCTVAIARGEQALVGLTANPGLLTICMTCGFELGVGRRA